jgi:hypothetical protein
MNLPNFEQTVTTPNQIGEHVTKKESVWENSNESRS